MKLYTEYQVREILKKAFWQDFNEGDTEQSLISELTPIELPTLEEIELKSVEYSTNTETKEFYKDCCWDFQNGVS